VLMRVRGLLNRIAQARRYLPAGIGEFPGQCCFSCFEAKTVFPLMQNSYGGIDLTLFGDYTVARLTKAAMFAYAATALWLASELRKK